MCVHAANTTLLALVFINAAQGQTCQNQFTICTRSANEWHKWTDCRLLTDYELQMSQCGYQHVFVTDISLFNVHSLFNWCYVHTYNDIWKCNVWSSDVWMHCITV